jgi:hypothetical protein
MSASELHDLIVEKRGESEKAILVSDGTREAWLPKSQVEIEENRDGTLTLTAPVWLLEEKELV